MRTKKSKSREQANPRVHDQEQKRGERTASQFQEDQEPDQGRDQQDDIPPRAAAKDAAPAEGGQGRGTPPRAGQ